MFQIHGYSNNKARYNRGRWSAFRNKKKYRQQLQPKPILQIEDSNINIKKRGYMGKSMRYKSGTHHNKTVRFSENLIHTKEFESMKEETESSKVKWDINFDVIELI